MNTEHRYKRISRPKQGLYARLQYRNHMTNQTSTAVIGPVPIDRQDLFEELTGVLDKMKQQPADKYPDIPCYGKWFGMPDDDDCYDENDPDNDIITQAGAEPQYTEIARMMVPDKLIDWERCVST